MRQAIARWIYSDVLKMASCMSHVSMSCLHLHKFLVHRNIMVEFVDMIIGVSTSKLYQNNISIMRKEVNYENIFNS